MAKEGPKFTIFLDYTTGDSFRTEHVSDEEIGFAWTDYDKAYKAAQLIKNHNELLDQYEGTFHWHAKERQQAWDAAMQSEWRKLYKKLYPKHKVEDEFDLFYHFAVEDDDGEPVVINPFWYGYFEHLHGIRIGFVEENIL